MNLLFSLDRRLLEQLYNCLHSIARFPTEGGYDTYIMSADIGEEDLAPARKMLGARGNIHLLRMDEELFKGYPTSDRYPEQIYYRLLAAKYLPPELDRILYLDVDIVAIKPLDELYGTDFEGKCFAACTHIGKAIKQFNCLRLNRESGEYVNTGVLLMNLPPLRENTREDEIKAFTEEYGERFMLPDQDILFALYGDEIKLLDWRKYNLSEKLFIEKNVGAEWMEENTVIIHYCGRNKPWKPGMHGPLAHYYLENARDAADGNFT